MRVASERPTASGLGFLARPGTPPRATVASVSTRLFILTSVSAMFLATSSAPTPLYPVYARVWNLSSAATSLVFGAYALALLAALLVFGRLSDHLGRRPVIWTALAIQVMAMVVFASAFGFDGLLCGRVLQGLSTGAGLAAVGTALVDVDAAQGTVANAIAPPVGSAAGAVGSAILVQFAPSPTRLVYLVFVGLLVLQALSLRWLPETAPKRAGALSSLRPRVLAPRSVRKVLIAALPVLFAVWALSGLFGALGPDLTSQLGGSTSPVLGALPIAIVGGVSPVAAFLTMRLAPRVSLARGIGGLLAGVAVTATAVLISEVSVLLIGAAIAGVGFGLGFRGGMQLVLPAVSRAERAGALSLLYVASYLGFGVPVIVAGVVAQQTNDLTATTLGYAVLLVLLALVATAALRATRDGIELRDGAQLEGSSR